MKLSTGIAIVALGMLGLGACSSGSKGPAAGTVRGACYPNGTCNAGLSCFSNVCVDTRPDGGKDAAGDAAKDATTVDSGDDRAAPRDAGVETSGDAASAGDAAVDAGDATTGDAADAGAFTPASLTGLALWLEADKGVQLADGGMSVASWNDQSPAHLVGSAIMQPAVVKTAAFGTHPGIDMTNLGNVEIAVGALNVGTKPFLLEMVLSDVLASAPLYLSTSNVTSLSVGTSASDDVGAGESGGAGPTVTVSTVKSIATGAHLVGVQIDGSGNLSVRVDGVVANTLPGATGDLGVTGSYFGHAVFGEIVAVVGPVSANDVTALEGYFVSKYTQ